MLGNKTNLSVPVGQFPECVSPSTSQAAINDCVWSSNENSVTSSHKYRHLPEILRKSPTVTMPRCSLLSWLHHEIQILGTQICDTCVTFNSNVWSRHMHSIKSIQKSALSRIRLRKQHYTMQEEKENICVFLGAWAPKRSISTPKYCDTGYSKYQNNHVTLITRSNSIVTWQTSGSYAIRRPFNPPPSFSPRRGCCVLPTQQMGPENGVFGRNSALISDSSTTNSDRHTWKDQSVTCCLINFFL